MGIDFHDSSNRHAYTSRHADTSWSKTMESLVPIESVSLAVDIRGRISSSELTTQKPCWKVQRKIVESIRMLLFERGTLCELNYIANNVIWCLKGLDPSFNGFGCLFSRGLSYSRAKWLFRCPRSNTRRLFSNRQ